MTQRASIPRNTARIPIIQLHGNLIVPIQISLSDDVVAQLKEDITVKLEATGARGLIIDLTGIEMMDSYISRTVRDVALVARLMGVPTVMCGMAASIAMTLAEMGIELQVVRSALNLEAALNLLAAERADEDPVDLEALLGTELLDAVEGDSPV